jgi:hypothetical protein
VSARTMWSCKVEREDANLLDALPNKKRVSLGDQSTTVPISKLHETYLY